MVDIVYITHIALTQTHTHTHTYLVKSAKKIMKFSYGKFKGFGCLVFQITRTMWSLGSHK